MNNFRRAFVKTSTIAAWFIAMIPATWAAGSTSGDIKPIEPPPQIEVTGKSWSAANASSVQAFLDSLGRVSSSGGLGGGGGGKGGGDNSKPDPQDNSDDCGKTKNPVIVASGEKVKTESDFSSFGLHGLSLDRTYRSKNATGILFGSYWPSSLDPVVLSKSTQTISTEAGPRPARATLKFPGGAKYVYTIDPADGNTSLYQVGDNTKMGVLIYSANGAWTLYYDQKKYSFNSGGGIVASVDRYTGERLLTITRLGQLVTQIKNLVGQTVNFSWTDGRLTQATDPAGRVWAYEYNAQGMLSKVTSPGPSPDIRTYHYEDANFTLLTGISINGTRYSTYAYHSDMRVSVSGLAGGEERDQFSYGTNSTTVTSEKGLATTYTTTISTQEATTRKISTASRTAGTNCIAAAATTVYDINGYVDNTLDWNGNKTDYTYDSNGTLLDITTAADSSVALKTSFVWASSENLAQRTFLDRNGAAYAREGPLVVSCGTRHSQFVWADANG